MKKTKKSKLKIFKYNALLSFIFFLFTSIYFGWQNKNFNLSDYTISEISKFLTEEKLTYFNMSFLAKAVMDLLFIIYVFNYFKIRLFSINGISWILAIFSFGALGFFPVSKYQMIHNLIVVVMFSSFSLSEFLMARLIKDEKFVYLTQNLLIIQITSIILFFITGNFNGVFEIFYMITAFLWLIIFIKNYLK